MRDNTKSLIELMNIDTHIHKRGKYIYVLRFMILIEDNTTFRSTEKISNFRSNL